MSRLRINIDNLDWKDYVYYINNKPFFGIGFELFENGKLRTEIEFNCGLYHGICKEWYENGQLESQECYNYGIKHGMSASWYEDGRKKSLSNYEVGVLVTQKLWDDMGNTTKDFVLTESDNNYAILLLNRQREPERQKNIIEKLTKS